MEGARREAEDRVGGEDGVDIAIPAWVQKSVPRRYHCDV